MELEQSGRSNDDCRRCNAAGAHEEAAEPNEHPVNDRQIRGSSPLSLDDEELVFDNEGLRDDGSYTAGATKPREGHDEVNEDALVQNSPTIQPASSGRRSSVAR